MNTINEWFHDHPHVRWTLFRFGLYIFIWNTLITLNYLAFHGYLN